MSRRAESILVIQLAKLGDFIQSTPLLAAARQKWPGRPLALACAQKSVAEAAAVSPLVDEIIQPNDTPPPGRFAAVLVLNSHPKAAALGQGVGAAEYYGPKLAGERLAWDTPRAFLARLMARRRLGRFNLVDVWRSLLPGAAPGPLIWPAPDSAAAPPPIKAALAGRFKVGFQLGCQNRLRRWPAEDFAALAAELSADLPVAPILFGVEAEKALGAKFKKFFPSPETLDLMGATSLSALAAALAELDLLVSADTGVMHLAAAVGTPVLSLFFGPAFGPETGPYGPGHLIYQSLADCAPCREGAGCRERLCPTRPRPETAAALARSILLKREPAIDPAPHERVWRTGLDGFGQTLGALGRPALTEDDFLALLIREAARPIFRPAYQPETEKLSGLLEEFAPPPKKIEKARCFAFIEELSRTAFPADPTAGQAFWARSRELSECFFKS